MPDIPSLKLNNGLLMPQLGLGVWEIPASEVVANVGVALEGGYRLIDTAAAYRNEAGVGEAIRGSGLARENVFVTSKLWNNDHGYDAALKAYDASLERLGLDYLDLYLIHWPAPKTGKYVETWRAFEQLYKDGRVKAIGVSNFQIPHLERLAQECEIVPAVNQIELHPKFSQDGLRQYHAAHGIVTESWSPLRGVIGDDLPPVIADLARAYGKTPAQVILRWHVQLGLAVIPRSSKPERIRENRQVFDFELSDDDMKAISALETGRRIGPDPDTADF